MIISIKKKKLGISYDQQTLTDLEKRTKKKKVEAASKEKSERSQEPVSAKQTIPKSLQQTLTDVEREYNWKKSQERANERKKKFNTNSQSKELKNSQVTILSADNEEKNITIQINKNSVHEPSKAAPQKCADDPTDIEMLMEKPKKQPKSKGKNQEKSTVVKFDEQVAQEEENQKQLDDLKPKDEVCQIYKVYWSRRHDQIVAKIQLKRADQKKSGNLGRTRQFADTLAKVPVSQLKDRKSQLFIDFMSELIKDEIRRQRERDQK